MLFIDVSVCLPGTSLSVKIYVTFYHFCGNTLKNLPSPELSNTALMPLWTHSPPLSRTIITTIGWKQWWMKRERGAGSKGRPVTCRSESSDHASQRVCRDVRTRVYVRRVHVRIWTKSFLSTGFQEKYEHSFSVINVSVYSVASLLCVCVGQRAMTTAACALTGGFITASDRASSKTPSEEYTLCVGQNKHPASSGGTINYLYHRHNSRDALNIATCSSGRVKDDLCLMATLNFTAIGPCAFWGLGRHKMVVINCCSCSLETQNRVESGPAESSGFCLFLHNMPWSSSSSSVSYSWSVGDIEIAFYFCLNATMRIL